MKLVTDKNMNKSESRFFLNWQMPQSISRALFNSTSDQERQEICENWLDHTRIVEDLDSTLQTATQVSILQQFTDLNCEFAKKQGFSEEKMSCFMEIMHYVMKNLIKERPTEDASFEMFKELLLRHAIKRPPHSLAIFSLTDIKKIDLFALDTLYRHFDMYTFALTVKDMLHLT